MTVLAIEQEAIASGAGPGPPPAGRAGRLLGSGWVPAAMVLVLTVVLLWHYGVPAADLAAFGTYLVLGITLPGTLLWRALRRERDWLVLEVSAGTAAGYALEVLTYLPARALGLPLLVLAWPIGTIAVFAVVPGLRRHWRGPGQAGRVPVWWAWAVSAVTGFLMVHAAVMSFRRHGLSWPGNSGPYVDMPFHLALVGELRNHMPPMIPYVLGEPLNYHWFVYAEMAAASWVTGIEPQTLLYRLSLLPIVAATLVLMAVTACRIARRVWAGPLVVALDLLARAPSPYGWIPRPTVDGGNLGSLWFSPTQTFGAMLCLPVVLLLTDLLRGQRRGLGPWLQLSGLLAVVTGAKATFLPLLLAGLSVVVVVGLVADRRVPWAAVKVSALTGACLVFAQFVLFGGASQGLQPAPLSTMKAVGVSVGTGLVTRTPDGQPLVLVVALIFLLGSGVLWAGVLGLVRRPAEMLDPAVSLILGMGAAGIGVMFLMGHPALGQLYFLKSVHPYLTIAAVCGLAAVAPARTGGRRRAWIWALAAAGALACFCGRLLVHQLSGAVVPTRAKTGGTASLAWELLWPWAMLLAVVGLTAAGLAWGLRRTTAMRGGGLAIAISLCMGLSVAMVPIQIADMKAVGKRAASMMPRGAVRAARWLRANSSPGELVATNVHCRIEHRNGSCENRHFWISAYTERRVLVEGWGNTPTTSGGAKLFSTSHAYMPFWNQDLLAANLAAFQAPSPQTIGHLRDTYGVRWLFVARSRAMPSPRLGDFARLRFSAKGCAVYEVPA